jgi:hypothetical protein
MKLVIDRANFDVDSSPIDSDRSTTSYSIAYACSQIYIANTVDIDN